MKVYKNGQLDPHINVQIIQNNLYDLEEISAEFHIDFIYKTMDILIERNRKNEAANLLTDTWNRLPDIRDKLRFGAKMGRQCCVRLDRLLDKNQKQLLQFYLHSFGKQYSSIDKVLKEVLRYKRSKDKGKHFLILELINHAFISHVFDLKFMEQSISLIVTPSPFKAIITPFGTFFAYRFEAHL